MRKKTLLASSIVCVAGCAALLGCVDQVAASQKESGALFVKVGTLYVGNGQSIKDGALIIRGGRVTAVGHDLAKPSDATIIRVASGSITPGLIDANAEVEPTDIMTVPIGRPSAGDVLHGFLSPGHKQHRAVGCSGSRCSRVMEHASGKKCHECGFPDDHPNLAVGTRAWETRVEESSEVEPHTRVIDSLNLRSPDFKRLASGGVTTVYVAPDSAAVISSQGAIVHTSGPSDSRIIREAYAVKATFGTDPSWRGGRNRQPWRQRVDFRTRRPTTRMGVAWVFRKAFYDADRYAQGLPVHGADVPSEPAMRVLQQIRAGDIPLRVQARQQHDILSALRLTKEFGIAFTLEEATEAYRCLAELKARDVPVVFGPLYVEPTGFRVSSGEVYKARVHTFQSLLDAGIQTALTAHEFRDEDGLARQAMYAMRFGATLDQAIRAVTQTPAQILGIDQELGTLEKGKRADLVVWSGQPFGASSSPVVVIIGGTVVVDRRKG